MVVRKDSTFTGMWQEFTQYTNMHGMRSIGRHQNHPIRTTIWALLTIAGLFALGVNVYGGVTKYLPRSVTTDISIVFKTPHEFPAVTICNLNTVRKHVLDNMAGYNNDVTQELLRLKNKIKNYSSDPFAMNMGVGYTGTLNPITAKQDAYATATTQAPAAGNRRKRQAGPPPSGVAPTNTLQNYSTQGQNFSTEDNSTSQDNSTTIGQNYSTTIGQNYSTTIGQNYSTTIGQNYSTIVQNYSTTISQNYSTTIGQNYSTTIGQNYSTTIGQNYSTTIGQNYSTEDYTTEQDYWTSTPYSIAPEEFVTENGSLWAPSEWDEEYWSQFDDPYYYDSMWEVDYLKVSFLENLAKLESRIAHYLGHQKFTMITDCTFEGRICTPNNFSWTPNYKYGNCYTFNAGWNKTKELQQVDSPGPLHGLSLELFIEENQYTQEIAQSTGMKVVIHAPDRMPFPEDEGIQLPPGYLTSVGVRMVNIARAAYPLATECEDGTGVPNAYKSVWTPDVTYTHQVCIKTCTQLVTIKTCSCANAAYPYYPQWAPVFQGLRMNNGQMWNDTTIRICDSLGDIEENDAYCLERVAQMIQDDQTKLCRCNASCNDVFFNAKSSSSKWPSNQYSGTLMKKLAKRSPFWAHQLEKIETKPAGQNGAHDHGHEPQQNAAQRSLIDRNMLKLDVYYEDLNYELISESEAYNIYSLISDIGGNMGMWVGLSAIALCEFVELLIDLLLLVLTGGSLTRRKRSNETVEMEKKWLYFSLAGFRTNLGLINFMGLKDGTHHYMGLNEDGTERTWD